MWLRLGESGRAGCRHRRRGLHLGLEFAAHLRRGLCENAVMDGEEREFETIANAGLVVDRTQVVLDNLLRCFEPQRDFAILAALDDKRDDAHLLGCKSVANTCAYHVLFR